MKKNLLVLTVFLIQTVICFGQDNNLYSTNESNAKDCKIANKAIGLSNITSDTLTFQQFKQCDKITIEGIKGEQITSYKLSFIVPGTNDIYERMVSNNDLPDDLIQKVIDSQTTKIFLSDVYRSDGSNNTKIGYRSFCLK